MRFVFAAAATALSLLPAAGKSQPLERISPRTADALLHVLAHEIGHAMLREFDLPILATEVGRSWRRLIAGYRMPEDARVTEVALSLEDGLPADVLEDSGLLAPVYTLMSSIDWHSRITRRIDSRDGAAEWSRNGRTLRICDAYVARFEEVPGE